MSLLLPTSVLNQQGAGAAEIAYVGKGTFTSAAATTLSLNVDPGHSTGDLLIAIINTADNATISGPAGWTELQQVGGAAGPDNQAGAWYRFATGSEGSTEDWTSSVANMAGICVAFSGVVSVADTSANDARGTNIATYSYTGTLPTVDSGDWLLFYGCSGASSARTFTAPSGSTEVHDEGGSPASTMAVAHQGPLESAPTAELWGLSGSGYIVAGPVLMKVT